MKIKKEVAQLVPISPDEMKRFVIDILKGLIDTPDDNQAFVYAVRAGLNRIVKKYTTNEYAFNLSMEYFVGRAPSSCYDALDVILHTDLESAREFADDEDNLDVAFAAYYALSLIYKKQRSLGKLKDLLGEQYDVLDCYPLRYEVKARYYKRIGKYDEALHNDEMAIMILEDSGIVNPAVGISYASTVCNILENARQELGDDVIERARENIESAIAFNPNYPKYYFLKAKLLFYSLPRSAGDEEIQKTVHAVNESIKKAEVALFKMHNGQGKFKATEEKEYTDFKNRVQAILKRRNVPMFPKTAQELDALKECILAAESQDVCTSTAILPPVPDLQKGDRYFFVCYSSRDFRSVYCDLIELYKQHVPFRYDERLDNGRDWEKQVEQYISDPDCVGVVFYLSRNILATGAVCKEMDFVQKYQKRHFAVNLEDGLEPSKILIQIILEAYSQTPPRYEVSESAMGKFLNFFPNAEVFTTKFRKNKDNGTEHIKAYINDIIKSFPTLIVD